MGEDYVTFFGSDEDLQLLCNELKHKSFQEVKDTALNASGGIAAHGISFALGLGIGKCVRAWIAQRGKRIVTRTESKIIIEGAWSADEVDKILKAHSFFDVEDSRAPLR